MSLHVSPLLDFVVGFFFFPHKYLYNKGTLSVLIRCIFSRPLVEVSVPMDSEVNLKLQNIMMLLRKCCNHPYLIEYPLDPATQQFKVHF